MTINMDEKAANDGDKLKHSVLLETLGRCAKWKSLTYSETHAGAGKYSLGGQKPNRQHIAKLFDLVDSLHDNEPSKQNAGGRYWHLLRNWWNVSANKKTYPGSVLQAACFLKNNQVTNARFRVTEADKRTYRRLRRALSELDDGLKCANSQDEIGWLTANDSLVLLIDPLSFGENFGNKRDHKLNNGGIDLCTLDQVLRPCWKKKAAVMLFWSSFAHESGSKKLSAVDKWLKLKTRQHTLRCFCARHYYMFVVGVGKGAKVVNALPDEAAWRASWLKTVHECS